MLNSTRHFLDICLTQDSVVGWMIFSFFPISLDELPPHVVSYLRACPEFQVNKTKCLLNNLNIQSPNLTRYLLCPQPSLRLFFPASVRSTWTQEPFRTPPSSFPALLVIFSVRWTHMLDRAILKFSPSATPPNSIVRPFRSGGVVLILVFNYVKSYKFT